MQCGNLKYKLLLHMYFPTLPHITTFMQIDLSLGDLINFCSTCYWVGFVLTPPFQKLCLQVVGKLTALQWAAVRSHAKLIELAISNSAAIDLPFLGDLTLPTLGVRGNLSKKNFRNPFVLANTELYYNNDKSKFLSPYPQANWQAPALSVYGSLHGLKHVYCWVLETFLGPRRVPGRCPGAGSLPGGHCVVMWAMSPF